MSFETSELHQPCAVEMARLQAQRDELADLVRVAVAHVGLGGFEADRLLERLDKIMRGEK